MGRKIYMDQLYLKDHLEKLYPFKVIADLGGVTAASKMLGLSQSNLSYTMKALENSLQVKLLNRLPRGITLTPEGYILYEFSKRIFHQTDNVELKIRNLGDDEKTIIKIATHETLAIHVWPRFIKETTKLRPTLKISLMSGRIDSIINDLLNGNVDLALTVEPLANPRIVSTTVYRGDFAFYTSKDDKRKSINLKFLEQEQLLTDMQAHFRQGMPIPQYLALEGLKFQRSYSLNSFEAAINLASMGLGLCMIPRRNAQKFLDEKKIKEIKIIGLKYQSFGRYKICATYLKENQSNILLSFIDDLITFFK